MEIYKLTIKSLIEPDGTIAIVGYREPKYKTTVEYYKHKYKAEERKMNITKSMTELLGFVPRLDLDIQLIIVDETV